MNIQLKLFIIYYEYVDDDELEIWYNNEFDKQSRNPLTNVYEISSLLPCGFPIDLFEAFLAKENLSHLLFEIK